MRDTHLAFFREVRPKEKNADAGEEANPEVLRLLHPKHGVVA